MLKILLVLFVLVPLAELYVLIEVGGQIGGFTTIVLCVFTAALGGLIIRWQGLQTLLQARKSMAAAQHQDLAAHAQHGLLLVAAGVLLFIPGLITDTLGFLLLVPALRAWLISRQRAHTNAHASFYNHGHGSNPRYARVIDAEVVESDKVHKD